MADRERSSTRPKGRVFVARNQVMDRDEVRRALVRIADEIVERNRGLGDVVVIGIQKGGVPLASQLVAILREIEGTAVPFGTMDVAFYRDDIAMRPVLSEEVTDLPFDLTGRTVVLFDDVLFTGRTVRAALESLAERGRASSRAAGRDGRPRSPGAADPPRLRGQEPADPARRARRGIRRGSHDR